MPIDLQDGYKIIYEEDSNLKPISPTGADVINEINENKYGILINNNHGSTMQYAVSTAGDNGMDENNKPIPGDNLKYQVMAQDDYDEIVDPTTNKRVRSMTIQEF